MFIEQAWNYWVQDWVEKGCTTVQVLKLLSAGRSKERDKKSMKSPQQEHKVHTAGMIRESTMVREVVGGRILLQPKKAFLTNRTLRWALLKNEEDFNRTVFGKFSHFI